MKRQSMNDQSSDDEVGYAKPPKEGRFQKGTSGNPAGRPKGSKNRPNRDRVSEIILDEMYKPVTVKQGGTTREMPAVNAMMNRLKNEGLKGDHRAQRFALSLATAAEDKVNADRRGQFCSALAYVKSCRSDQASRQMRNLPPKTYFPDPDHFLFDFDTETVTIAYVTPDEAVLLDFAFARKAQLQDEISAILDSDEAIENFALDRQELKSLFDELKVVLSITDLPWPLKGESQLDYAATKAVMNAYLAENL